MATRANSSRERILSVAEEIILQQGFAGTTIEEIIDKSAITKGGFFYHFNGKMELARALVDRYIDTDMQVFSELNARADELSEDPLQRLLIFLNLLAEMVSGMTSVHPGCLVAAFAYEAQQFDEQIRENMKVGILGWRQLMVERLNQVLEKYPPKIEISVDMLGDMFSSTLEGGIILARVYNSNKPIIEQVHAYRTHLRMIFGDL